MLRWVRANTQQGSAVITALFIVTLVAIIATSMAERLRLDIYRSGLIFSNDKLFLASQVVTFWAMDRLSDPKQPLMNLDQNGRVLDFPTKLSAIYPGVITEGAIYDLQSRYNLNNVTNSTFLPMYLGLLEQTLPGKDSQTRKQIVDATLNWIQGPSKSQVGHDEWLDQYLKQKPVYFPSYQNMQHESELRLVLGITPPLYRALKPYVTALPEVTPINLNTAPLALLRALGDGLSTHDAEAIIKLRLKKPITDMSELGPIIEKMSIPATQITFTSQYFLVVSQNTLGEHQQTHHVLLKRVVDKQGKMVVTMLQG